MIAEFAIKRLRQIGEPENRRVTRVELEIVEDDLLTRIDRRLLRADPVVGILHVVGGDAGVISHKHLPAIPFLRSELARLQQEGVHGCPQPAAVEELALVEINRLVAALHQVPLIDGDVPFEGHGFLLQVQSRCVGEHLQTVVALDFDRTSEPHAGFDVAFDSAALIVDLKVLGHLRLESLLGAERDFRRRHRNHRVHGRRKPGVGCVLRRRISQWQEKQRGDEPCGGFQHRTDHKSGGLESKG